ncbi:MAG: tetraacyldisaccharide 4'-kinase [Parvibaculales bacterium]|jgi:tetraacyldisaccharide 4'-kinase
MAEPKYWNNATDPLSLGLRPVSWAYHLLEASNRFFVKPQHPGKPVICVGNLTAGGAGKTPVVRFLAEHFSASGRQPAILSRGYGGTLSDKSSAVRVDSHCHSAKEVGDEPLMLAADWPVYICPDRFASLRAAVADGAHIALKDDGFQNPSMAHHFNLVVIDGASGIGNGQLLPAGPLRQALPIALAKADALLVMGAATHDSFADLLPACQAHDVAVFYGRTLATPPALPSQEKPFAYCGIAKPEKFLVSLAACDVALAGHRAFADHHHYTEADAVDLLRQAQIFITTEKDMARLKYATEGSALKTLAEQSHVLKINVEIDEADKLTALIDKTIDARQANQSYKSY